MHELDGAPRLLQHVGLAVAVAVVDERAGAGGGGDARREVAPLPDRAQPFVQEHQRWLAALLAHPFVAERAARRLQKSHRFEDIMRLPCAPPPISRSSSRSPSGRETGSSGARCARTSRRRSRRSAASSSSCSSCCPSPSRISSGGWRISRARTGGCCCSPGSSAAACTLP